MGSAITFKEKYRKLYRLYDKQLKKAHKKSYKEFMNPMDYFVTYLKFMRDYYILASENKNTISNSKIASLTSAVTEIAKYKDCINKYFDIDKGKAKVQPKEGKDFSEALQEYLTESQGHWIAFWALVSANMESWMELGDIVDGNSI